MPQTTSQILIADGQPPPNPDENEDSAHTFLDLGTNTLVKCSMPVVPGSAPVPHSPQKTSKKAQAKEDKPEPRFR